MDETGVVLLVEDDRSILRINRRVLEGEGFTVLCAETLAEARRHLAASSPDVYVLDIMLPDGSGLDFCAGMRDGIAAPVLFLTALDEQHEVIAGLAAGGNDYITKPYDVEEFLARVKAQLALAQMNRKAAGSGRILTRGPLTLDIVKGMAFLDGVDMLLTPKEHALLAALMEAGDGFVTSEALYERIWSAPLAGSTTALKTVISRLRGKLEAGGFSIYATRGRGYRLERQA